VEKGYPAVASQDYVVITMRVSRFRCRDARRDVRSWLKFGPDRYGPPPWRCTYTGRLARSSNWQCRLRGYQDIPTRRLRFTMEPNDV